MRAAKTRVSRTLLPLIGVLQTDKQKRPTKLTVPGSDGKRYDVLLYRRDRSATILVECLLSVTGTSTEPCLGSLRGLCYHVRAALLKALSLAGYNRAAFCATYTEAKKMQNLIQHGGIIFVTSHRQQVTWYKYLVYGKATK